MQKPIVFLGKENVKVVGGKEEVITPFVALEGTGAAAHLGVGLKFADNSVHIWGLMSPRRLIQSWRAMTLLEAAERIEHRVLFASWYAVQAGDNPQVLQARRHIVNILPENFGKKILEEVRVMAPNPQVLHHMVERLLESRVLHFSDELFEEVTAGRLQRTPMLDKLFRTDMPLRAS